MNANNTAKLRTLIATENRKIAGEALLTAALGLGISLVVYGGVFWLSWIAFFFWLRGLRIGSETTSALLVTAVFALGGIVAAWRRHDPMDSVRGMDPDMHDLQMGLGYALGVPVVNRQSIAGFASLLIGGPANVLEAFALWRKRLPADAMTAADAVQLLEQSRHNLTLNATHDRKQIVLLHRLGLVKTAAQSGRITLALTMKGAEFLNGSTPPRA